MSLFFEAVALLSGQGVAVIPTRHDSPAVPLVKRPAAFGVPATARGQITPDEAALVASLLEVKRRAIETVELEGRLTKLEAAKEGAQ
jgi:hypothetical protein